MPIVQLDKPASCGLVHERGANLAQEYVHPNGAARSGSGLVMFRDKPW